MSDEAAKALAAARSRADALMQRIVDEAAVRVAEELPGVDINPVGLKLAALTIWRAQLAELDPIATRTLLRSLADMCSPNLTAFEFRRADKRRREAIERLVVAAERAPSTDGNGKGEADGREGSAVPGLPGQG